MHWTKLISSEVHLLKGKVIQDICRAPVVYQHPSSWIISNNQGDNDGIVMRVMYSWGILVRESDCLLVWSPRFGRSSLKPNVLHYLQVRLSWPRQLTCWTSPNNHSDFSERRSWRLLYLCLQLFILVVSSKEIPQLPLSNEILNLLLKVKTFISIMPMISMEATILIPIELVRIPLIFSGHFKNDRP